jgi:membrane protease YdiL (CAAX protease family)
MSEDSALETSRSDPREGQETQFRAIIWFLILVNALGWPYMWHNVHDPLAMTHQFSSPIGWLSPWALRNMGLLVPINWVPGVSAILIVHLVLRENWRVTTLNRLGPSRYIVAGWVVFPALAAITLGASLVTGAARIDPTASLARQAAWGFGNAPIRQFHRLYFAQLIGAEVVYPAIYGLLLVGEEIGWRGFLLPRLIRVGLSQWQALILTGIFWGVWHAPAAVVVYQSLWGIAIYTFSLTLLGITLGWLALASGSIWPAAIAHGANDSVVALIAWLSAPYFNNLGGGLDQSLVGWLVQLVFVVWLIWTRRLPVRAISSGV